MSFTGNHPNRSRNTVRHCAWCNLEVTRWEFPPWCSMRCALKYARAAFRAGFRAPPKEPNHD